MEKNTIRHFILEQLKTLSEVDRVSYDTQLLRQLVDSELWQHADSIGVTLSNFPEVDTAAVIAQAWQDGKKVYIPYSGENGVMTFFAYTPDTELERSRFGIREPKYRDEAVDKEKIALMVVPGVAYNNRGYRIGFGGGYYDRYLADYQGDTCSLLYPFQLDERISNLVESFDIPVQKLFIAQHS